MIVSMSEPLPEELATRWYDYWRRLSGSREERKALQAGEPRDVVAAAEWVSELVEGGGVVAVVALVALAVAAPDGDDGVTVGVGPVEDLLYTHGDDVLDELVDHARRVPAFARALSYVSLSEGSVSTSSLAKLDQFRQRR